jgi:hypothetical protein
MTSFLSEKALSRDIFRDIAMGIAFVVFLLFLKGALL